jgi:formylglycine-generating enzyme required for sulfatase activity
MRKGTIVATALAAAMACTVSTDPLGPAEPADGGVYATKAELGVYATKAELEALAAKVAFLDGCEEGDVLVRDGAGWTCTSDPPCPAGFAATTEESFTVCTRRVGKINDVMVRVGDFWIDRYEVSACPGGSLGSWPGNGNDTTAAACSTTEVSPQTNITWFQAAQMCANAGKHLCTNAEWQAAVAGTPDPGKSSGLDGECVTDATGLRMTGQGTKCRSRYGAEDMIGNVWEWAADWFEAGRPWQTVDGQSPAPAGPWPPGYHDDQTWNVDGTAADPQFGKGLPAAPIRGGDSALGTQAGAFALYLGASPSHKSPNFGARCCAGRR